MGWMEGAGEHTDGVHPLELSRLSTPPPPWQPGQAQGVDSWVERWGVSGPARLVRGSRKKHRASVPGNQVIKGGRLAGRQASGRRSVRSSTTKRGEEQQQDRLVFVCTDKRTYSTQGTRYCPPARDASWKKQTKIGQKEGEKSERRQTTMPSRLAGLRPFPSQRFGSKTPVLSGWSAADLKLPGVKVQTHPASPEAEKDGTKLCGRDDPATSRPGFPDTAPLQLRRNPSGPFVAGWGYKRAI